MAKTKKIKAADSHRVDEMHYYRVPISGHAIIPAKNATEALVEVDAWMVYMAEREIDHSGTNTEHLTLRGGASVFAGGGVTRIDYSGELTRRALVQACGEDILK